MIFLALINNSVLQTSVADLVSMELGGGKGLSSREKNRARRMARKAAKNRTKEMLSTSSSLGSQEGIGYSFSCHVGVVSEWL